MNEILIPIDFFGFVIIIISLFFAIVTLDDYGYRSVIKDRHNKGFINWLIHIILLVNLGVWGIIGLLTLLMGLWFTGKLIAIILTTKYLNYLLICVLSGYILYFIYMIDESLFNDNVEEKEKEE